MTTQAEYMSLVRNKLYDLNIHRFSDEALRQWINEAASDVARRTQCLRTTGTITGVASTQGYIPTFTDIIAIHAVKFIPDGGTFEYDLEYFDYKPLMNMAYGGLSISEGRPFLYWTEGYPPNLQINLYPTPSEAGDIVVHYYKTFAKLATADSTDANTDLDFPNGWESLLVNFAVAEGLLSDRDNRHQTYRDLYEQQLGGFNETSIRYNDNAGQITPNTHLLGNYELYGWGY